MMRLAALFLALAASSTEPAKMEFDKYQLVILRSAPGAKKLTKEEHAKLMEGHLGHFGKLTREGKMVVAGPFDEQDDKTALGLCLYRVGSVAEARALAEQDPAVTTGQMRVEAMIWYSEKGAVAFPLAERMRAGSTR